VSPRGGNGHDDELPVDEVTGAATGAGQPAPESAPDPAPTAPDAAGTAPDAAAGEIEEGLQELPPTREQLDALRRERDEATDALLRRRAEFENFRKRSEREQQSAATEATASVLRRFLETVDNLERALGAAPGAEQALRHGVELTLHDLQATLEAQGVEVVDPQGQRFDPNRHQALLHEPVSGFAEGMVAEVFRKGYLYKDRLLRPALVKVASGGAAEGPVDAGGGGEVQ
jgi:molecular chaperone GrpE